MDLNKDFIGRISDTAKAYDAETDMTRRVALGAKLDEMADLLSEGQLRQVSKMLMR